MKKNVVADTSFYICHSCNLNRTDLLCKYLDLYQFYYGPIIRKEIPPLGKNDNYIRGKITLNKASYTEIIKPFSERDESHIDADGEYEAISIALELALTNQLGYLILDDKSPKNFAKEKFLELLEKIVGTLDNKSPKNFAKEKSPELLEKIVGTLGFIQACYKTDSLITKNECLSILKAIHEAYLEYKQKKDIPWWWRSDAYRYPDGAYLEYIQKKDPPRPCGMDEKIVESTLKPMIRKLRGDLK